MCGKRVSILTKDYHTVGWIEKIIVSQFRLISRILFQLKRWEYGELSLLPCEFTASAFLSRLLSLRSSVISLQETSCGWKSRLSWKIMKSWKKISPSLILSRVSVSTKLRSAIEIPHRIAPAWPISPPPSTLASTSTFCSIPLNIKGNMTFFRNKLILDYFFLERFYSNPWIDFRHRIFIKILTNIFYDWKQVAGKFLQKQTKSDKNLRFINFFSLIIY